MSDRIVVYRMQAEDGRGPYRPGTTQFWADEGWQRNNPSIFDDFPKIKFDKLTPYCGCACESVEDLLRWFSEGEQRVLHILGYRICEVEVDEIIARSDRQMIVRRRAPFYVGPRIVA